MNCWRTHEEVSFHSINQVTATTDAIQSMQLLWDWKWSKRCELITKWHESSFNFVGVGFILWVATHWLTSEQFITQLFGCFTFERKSTMQYENRHQLPTVTHLDQQPSAPFRWLEFRLGVDAIYGLCFDFLKKANGLRSDGWWRFREWLDDYPQRTSVIRPGNT